MRRTAILLAIGMLIATWVPAASAQESYSLSGQVLDQDGVPVTGATVWLYQDGWGDEGWEDVAACDGQDDCVDAAEPSRSHQETKATTDADGRFTLAVQAGWASINIHKEGHASHHDRFEISGDDVVDIQLLRYPDKTAHVQGRITPQADHYSISIQHPELGLYACSSMAGDGNGPRPLPADGGSSDGSEPAAGEADPKPDDGSSDRYADGGGSSASTAIAPGEWYSGCDIVIQPDGSFQGNVTPGYSILRVHAYDWQSGGPGYYSHASVRDLRADATTALDIRLQPRPGPDAIMQGYILDGESGDVVQGASISFHNQDAYGWADARSDGDGSYQVRLRSGYTGLSVWADGYLPWEGQVQIGAGDEVRFDIELTPGQARYGGCCFAFEKDGVRTMDAAGEQSAPASEDGDTRSGNGSGNGSGAGFEDLGGGLGPYDSHAGQRDGADEPVSVPGFEILAVALGLLAAVLLVRRR